jgi:hypothetical protein
MFVNAVPTALHHWERLEERTFFLHRNRSGIQVHGDGKVRIANFLHGLEQAGEASRL